MSDVRRDERFEHELASVLRSMAPVAAPAPQSTERVPDAPSSRFAATMTTSSRQSFPPGAHAGYASPTTSPSLGVENTIVGWVNGYATDAVPLSWQPLSENEFPTFPPPEAANILTPKNNFVKDPHTCNADDCPLVFKFTLKRVAP